jgi:hypothetical protein
VGDSDIAGDTKGLLVGIDVLEVGGKVEATRYRVMKGMHVVVRYVVGVAYGEVASDEVVAGNVRVVVDRVQAMHDAVMGDAVMGDAVMGDEVIGDEALGDVQVKVHVVVVES